MPLIPLGWDICPDGCLPLSLLPVDGWASTAPCSPSISLSPAMLLNSARSTEMGITSVPQACPHPVAIECCFGAEAEDTNLSALGHHRDGGNCHTCRMTDPGKG